MNKLAPRLLVVTHAFPPHAAGSSILMANLLKEYPGERLVIAGYSRYLKEDKNFIPPCPVAFLKPPNLKIFRLLFARFINSNRWYVRRFFSKHVKRFKPDVILGVFPHSTFFVAAYEVSKKYGIPFYSHMHDLWQENYADGNYARKLADKHEKTILMNSTRVFCMTSTQADHYANKYGIKPEILPHTILPGDLSNLQYQPVQSTQKQVLFAGALSDVMNADALAVFSRSKPFLKNSVDYVLYTNAGLNDLGKYGVDVNNIKKKWVTRRELMEEIKKADILFAPLSHKHCSALEVKTVFSTKLLEYLIAGRPILLFAPADSFHAVSARKNNWAYVVDTDDPEAIAKAIDELLTNETVAREIVEGAFKEARERNAKDYAVELYRKIETDCKRSNV